jgi:hypothetical protein
MPLEFIGVTVHTLMVHIEIEHEHAILTDFIILRNLMIKILKSSNACSNTAGMILIKSVLMFCFSKSLRRVQIVKVIQFQVIFHKLKGCVRQCTLSERRTKRTMSILSATGTHWTIKPAHSVL